MTQHTPGPWFAKFEAGRYVITYQGEFGPHRSLAITGGFQPDNEANARLIAAAPDLLEAAELCRKYMYEHASNTQDNAFDKLCSAIAKATGKA